MPYLGLVTDRIPPALGAQLGLPEGFGLVVEQVLPDSPAATAGVQQYDVVKLFNDQQIVDPGQLSALVRSAGKDTEVTLTLLRKTQEQKVTVKIGERAMPEPRAFRMPGGDVLRNLHERVEEHTRGLREIPQRLPKLVPDQQSREIQERVRQFHDKVKDWTKGPSVGTAPQLPGVVSHAEAGSGQTNVLRLALPGAPTTDGSAKGSHGSARVVVTDAEGELEVRSENGRRTITAKTPAGEVILSEPIDTEEQTAALPEPIRKKLRRIEAQSTRSGEHSSSSASGSAGGETIPPQAPEPEVQ
ncbi:MAG: hypothetical protein JWQ44_1170 [Chthoniobacter sp.]|jgi:hypothetical protein|nr:hypothetical protein [Chthoniobacter sp.]